MKITDDIFRCIFFNENIWISITISLKFVPKVLIANKFTGSGNGLVPNRQEAITWTNADPVHRRTSMTRGKIK